MVKIIVRYLKGSDSLCLWYPKFSSFDVIGYSDADYAGYLVDQKSTSGMAQFIGPCLVSWGSRKQNCIALSTTEAEYLPPPLALHRCYGSSNSLMTMASP